MSTLFGHVQCMVNGWRKKYQDIYSFNGNTSYHQILQKFEAAIYGFRVVR